RRPAHAEIAHHRVPVPLGVGDRPALHVGERGEPVGLHEARDARALEVLGRRSPDDLAALGGHGPVPMIKVPLWLPTSCSPATASSRPSPSIAPTSATR